MGKFVPFVAILGSIILLACSPGSETEGRQSIAAEVGSSPADTTSNKAVFGMSPGNRGPAGVAGPAGAPGFDSGPVAGGADGVGLAPAATPAPAQALPPALEDSEESTSQLQTAQRRDISTASLSIEVETVPDAIARVRAIAEGLGGFVEQLSSFGGSEQQQASITVRVPQAQFFTALERLEELGEVQSRNVGSDDVSEQFIDLEARLKSALREEESLLSLLGKAQQVGEILTIERELSRVRSEIERLQGQLNFLERRVELATISVSLFPPQEEVPTPPSASLVVELPVVSNRVNEIKNLVSTLGGEVDRVFLSSRDGRERADISFRVFPKDFGQAVEFLEGSGDVLSKELSEGSAASTAETEQPEEPNSRIDISLVEPEPSNTGLIIAIAAPVGGVILVIILAVVLYFTYQAGRRQRDRSV